MWGVYTNIKKSNINWMVVVTTAHHRTEKGRGQHVLIVEQCTIFTLQFSKLITISVLMQFTQLLWINDLVTWYAWAAALIGNVSF